MSRKLLWAGISVGLVVAAAAVDELMETRSERPERTTDHGEDGGGAASASELLDAGAAAPWTPEPSGSAPGAPHPRARPQGGPNPFVVVALALLAGIALAKWTDRRGRAHPRR